jgi:hypothetical protein
MAHVSLLGENTSSIKRISEALLDASKGVDSEADAEKTKYMVMPCHQNLNLKVELHSRRN